MARHAEEEEEVDESGESEKGKKKKGYDDIHTTIEKVSTEMKMQPVDIARGKYCMNTFSTGSLTLDIILGGGYGIGRWVTIYGPSQAGKSTELYLGAAVLQRMGVPIEFFDHEGSIDPVYMRSFGVKLLKSKGFYNIPADVGEHTYRHIRRVLKRMPDVDRSELSVPTIVFFIDSLKSMVAEAMDEDDDKNPMGMAARMHRTYMPMVRSLLRRKGATILSTNQISANIGNPYANPEVEPGGNAVQHYPDIRIRLGRHSPRKGEPGVPSSIKIYGGGYIKEDSIYPDGGQDRMAWTTARTVKNRQFAPYQEGDMRLNMGRGFDPIYDAYSFLDMTGQVVVHKGQKMELQVDGWKEKKGKALDWLDFGRLVATSDFRNHCRHQMKDNTAFDMYFAVTIGRTSKDDGKKGKDPLAIYDPVEKSKKRHAKKEGKKKHKKK